MARLLFRRRPLGSGTDQRSLRGTATKQLVYSKSRSTDAGQGCRRSQSGFGIGANERVDEGPGNGTLYNTLLTFGSDGVLLNHHRKLIPTYTERIVWGQGDGGGLKAVNTSVGRIGGLVCWENWMPLAGPGLHDSGR